MATNKETKHLDSEKRPERQPLDGPRNILDIPNQDPAYHYTWQFAADVPRFLEAGYEFVTDPTFVGDPTVNKSSKINAPGNALTLTYKGPIQYALRQRNEWYDADRAQEEAKRLAQEQEMKKIGAGEYGKVLIGR